MSKKLEKPYILSWPTWKAMSLILGAGTTFTLFIWLLKTLWEPDRYPGFRSDPPSFPPLTARDILLGYGWLPVYLWIRWAWQPRRKHAHWHRWLARVTGVVYLCVLVLLMGMASWNTLLKPPWNWVVNSTLVVLFIVAWILPALSYRWSKRIARAQDNLGVRMLGGVGSLMVLAGILGASFGMHTARNGEVRSGLLMIGFLSSLVAVFLAQYNAEQLWPYRPWAKEEDE